MIDDGLIGSFVTAILIGLKTAGRTWVDYEIKQSVELGNGIIGVYIRKIANRIGTTDKKGPNPHDDWTINQMGKSKRFHQSILPTIGKPTTNT